MLFLCRQKAKDGEKSFWEEEPAPLLNFRVLTAVITLLALVAFFAGTWEISSFLGMAAAGALASAIVYFVFIWAASNGISILLSRGFREGYLRLNLAGDMSSQEASSSRLLWEVRDLFEFLADRNAALREEKNHVLRITSSVAHNVKPPLASIKAATFILESYGPARSDEAVVKQWRESMELLRGAYRSMKATADQMLTERKRIRKEEEIEVAAQTALRIAKDNYPDKCFTLNVADDAKGHVATSELSPHLLSLLSNAADATKTSAVPIELNVAQEEASIKIEIVDRGGGISPGLLTALRRGEERTTKAHGNGIGVSSIIRWVRENRYEFQLDSQVGEGTKAILRIPFDTGGVS